MKLFLPIIFVVYGFSLFSQNTLHRSNYFTSGNQHPYLYADSIKKPDIILAGSNVVWDFSNAQYQAGTDTTFAVPSDTTVFFNASNTNYYLSDLCLLEHEGVKGFTYDDNMYSYCITDSSGVNFIGKWANNGFWETWRYHLTNPETYFKFPFMLGDSFQDSFYGQLYDMGMSGLHKEFGTRTVTAEGIGTLVTPLGTYNNCLKIKAVRDYYDSSAIMGFNHYVRLSYTWFQLQSNAPVLEINVDTNFYNIETKHYFANGTVNLKSETKTSNVVVTPNPCNNELHVTVYGKDLNPIEICIRNLFGKEVFHVNNFKKQALDVSMLPTGVYFVEVTIENVSVIKKLVKE